MEPGRRAVILWICDVNGVLVDTVTAARNAFAATAAHGRFPFGDAEYRAVKSRTLLEAYRTLDPGGDPFALRAFHLRFMRDHLADIRAYPGVGEILGAARARHAWIGAVTSHGDWAVYVGDSPLDIEAGKAAGVVTVGVTYGVCDEAEIAAAGPDYIIHSFGEMRRFIDERPEPLVEGTRTSVAAAESVDARELMRRPSRDSRSLAHLPARRSPSR